MLPRIAASFSFAAAVPLPPLRIPKLCHRAETVRTEVAPSTRRQLTWTWNKRPTRTVAPPAMAMTSSWRSAGQGHERPPRRPSRAPIASADTAATTTEASCAVWPERKNHGRRGARAPAANVSNEEPAAAQGEPSSSGLRPSERAYVARACFGFRASSRAAAWAVRRPLDERFQLGARTLGIGLQVLRLFEQQALQQLDLGAHRDVFANGHRARSRDETRQAGEAHECRTRLRGRDAEDQRNVRHQPVADAQHRRSRSATLNVGGALAGVMRMLVLHRLGHGSSYQDDRRERGS